MHHYPNKHQQGSTLIIGIIVLVVLGLGVFYIVSDPFSTKVNTALTGATEWTPENIQKDPVNYLTWALGKTKSSVSQLKTSELSLTMKRNKTTQKSDALSAQIKDGGEKLSKAKKLYKSTETWPLQINGNDITQEQLKNKILEAHNSLENKKKLAKSHTKTNSIIKRKLTEVKNRILEAEQMKDKIATDLEIAKTNKAVAGITDIGSELNAIIATSDALSGASTDDMSLDDLLGDGSNSQNDAAFDSIMAD